MTEAQGQDSNQSGVARQRTKNPVPGALAAAPRTAYPVMMRRRSLWLPILLAVAGWGAACGTFAPYEGAQDVDPGDAADEGSFPNDAPTADARAERDGQGLDATKSDADPCSNIDLGTNPQNCGTCGHVCSTKVCVNGTCDPLVFATSATFNGNLVAAAQRDGGGGAASADALCQDAAAAAGVQGKFMAWICAGTTPISPSARFAKATRPYRNRDGTLIANDYGGLGSPLQSTIHGTEDGGPLVGTTIAWGDCTGQGVANGSGDCLGWTVSVGAPFNNAGNVGDLSSNVGWFQAFPDGGSKCDQSYRLLCFEQ